jgi:hypothetical protein
MHRIATFTLAAWLMALAIIEPTTAFAQRLPPADPSAPPSANGLSPTPPYPGIVMPEPMAPTPTYWSKWATPDTAAYGVGAVVGIGIFYFYLVPIAAAAAPNSAQSWLGTRVVASSVAAGVGVLTTYAYDLWANAPVDSAFFKSRVGAVAGVGVGSAALSLLGFPPSTALVRFSGAWAANRAFLLGSGLAGEGLTYMWLRNDTTPAP